MDDQDVPVTIRHDEEERPWQWLVRNDGDGQVKVEVGDTFEPSALFPGEEGALAQVGMSMVMMGLRFLAVDSATRRLIGELALSHYQGSEDA